MKKTSLYIVLLLSSFLPLGLQAQSRMLPIIELPASAEALSMGGVYTGDQQTAWIYTNPTAVFNHAQTWTADYHLGFLPQNNGTSHLHTFHAAHRLGNHAVLVGSRYEDMGTLNTFVDDDMQEVSKEKMRLSSYRFDAGYTFRISRKWAVYTTVGYASERTLTTISGWMINLGINHVDSFTLSRLPLRYNLTLNGLQLGRYAYSGHHGWLSSRIGLGGNISMNIAPKQQLSVFLDAGTFLPSNGIKASTELSGGIAYTFLQMVSVRIGGHTGDKDDFLSCGFSVRYGTLSLHTGMSVPLHKEMHKTYMAGLQWDI